MTSLVVPDKNDEGQRVVVMVSSGAPSMVAWLRAVERFGAASVVGLFCDTKVEDEDNYRFLAECEQKLGLRLHRVSDGRTPWEVAHDEHMIPNTRAKICSRVLKHEPAAKWLNEHAPDALIVVGIDWTEAERIPGIAAGHAPREVWAPLTEPPFHHKDNYGEVLREMGIEPPRMYRFGYPHANCGGACFLAGQAQWRHLLMDSPEQFAIQEAEEERFRAERGDFSILRDRTLEGIAANEGLRPDQVAWRQVPNERTGKAERRLIETATDRLLPSMVPLPLIELRRRVESGGQIDMLDWGGCGCTSGETANAPLEVRHVG